MASRADYLSKYLSNDASKKSKRNSKKKTNADEVTQIVIEGSGVFSKTAGFTDVKPINEQSSVIGTLPDPDDEFEPTSVELGSSQIVRKGFKRIDNGELVRTDGLDPRKTVKEEKPATIYRDQSGRIIDLETKQAQIKSRKEYKAKREILETDQLNTGELDRFKRDANNEKIATATRFDYSKSDPDYKFHMTSKKRFDDPFAGRRRTPSNAEEEHISATGRPLYNGGQHPANRFKIEAGHFWDGIDRGNGFEDRLVSARDLAYVKKVTERATQESYTEYDLE